LPAARRRDIIKRLTELAEDNVELNFNPIFKHCLRDSDPEIRTLAMEGLWECEESSLINVFAGMLARDASEPVQAAAATALGRFCLLAELGKLRPEYKEKLAGAVLAVIDDTSHAPEVRRRALEAAAPLSVPAVKKAIGRFYASGDRQLKTSALFAMGRSCDPDWLPALLREMTGPEPELRYEAAVAAGELGEAPAVPYLIRLLDDADAEVALAAITALGRVSGPAARTTLKKLLDATDEAVRQAAQQALAEMESGEDLLSFQF